MEREYLIIYNARPGSRASVSGPALARALERRGARAELWGTRPAMAGMDALDPSRYRAVLVVGGDGTFHHVLNGVHASPVPYGFLGTGTINVLSRELAIPREPEPFAGMVLSGRTVRAPSFRANDRRWALFFESGFLGRVVSRTNAYRERKGTHGQLEFAVAALRTLPASWGRSLHVRLELLDGRVLERSYSNVLLSRAHLYGGLLRIPVEREFASPVLEPSFLSFGYRTRTPAGHLAVLALGFLRLLGPLRRVLEATGLVECRRAVRARIMGPPTTGSHIDAETFEGMPIEIAPEAEGFRLLVP
jgi:diacylglycerol kinase family enzyme